MALFFRLIFSMLCAIAAHAFSVQPQYSARFGSDGKLHGPYGSMMAACQAAAGDNNANNNGGGTLSYVAAIEGGSCVNNRSDGTKLFVEVIVSQGCPANSVRSGNDCICNTDHAERLVNGAYSCVPIHENDCSKNGMIWNSDLTSDRSGRAKGPYSQFADGAISCFGGPDSPAGKGCKHMFTGELGFKDDQGQDWTNGFSWAFTEKDLKDPRLKGELSCDLVDTPLPDQEPSVKPNDPQCKNGYQGSVNGVDVCIEAWTGETQGVDFGITKGPDGTTTNTKSEITCKGDQCTIKETNTVKDQDGNTIRTTTSTTPNVNRRALCAKNPKSSVCGGGEDQSGGSKGQDPAGGGSGGGGGKGNGDADGDGVKDSFGGSCTAGFKCNGDAVQCAMAQEQHKRNCQLLETPTQESVLYDSIKDLKGDQTDKLEGAESIDIGNLINTSDALGGGSCIGDLNVVVMRQSVSLPFSRVCPYMAMLGNILVAVSMLLAARIITRG